VVGWIAVTLPCGVALPVHEPAMRGSKVACRLPIATVLDTGAQAGPEVLAMSVAATDVQLICILSAESVTFAEHEPPFGIPQVHAEQLLPSMWSP
jgi:hypothetical protein